MWLEIYAEVAEKNFVLDEKEKDNQSRTCLHLKVLDGALPRGQNILLEAEPFAVR